MYRIETERVISEPIPHSSIISFAGSRQRHEKRWDLKDVILKQGITQDFKAWAGFRPSLPTNIRPKSFSFIAHDYISEYALSVIGEPELVRD